jgi:hypothetical protein
VLDDLVTAVAVFLIALVAALAEPTAEDAASATLVTALLNSCVPPLSFSSPMRTEATSNPPPPPPSPKSPTVLQ